MELLIFSLSWSSVPQKGRLCTGDQRGSIKISTFPSSEFSRAAGRWQLGHGISRYIAVCLDTIPVYGCKMKPGGTFLFLSYGRIPKMPRLSQEWSPAPAPAHRYNNIQFTVIPQNGFAIPAAIFITLLLFPPPLLHIRPVIMLYPLL